MKPHEIMQDINQLLDTIVTRTIAINKKNFSCDYLLDVDLVQDDVRQLYRRLEMLRSQMAGDNRPFHMQAGEAGGHVSSGDDTSRQPIREEPPEAESQDVEPAAPPQEPAAEMKTEPDAPQQTDPVPPEIPDVPPAEEPKPAAQTPEADKPAEKGETRDVENMPPLRADADTDKQHTAAQGASPAGRPATDDTPAHSGQHPPATNKGNGNRAVIDILSEYSNRVIGDTYLQEDDNSLHNRLSNEREDKSIGERMEQQPLSNLKEAIGVNEKFLFINELFDGNIQAYNEAISRLNSMEDSAKAFDYLNRLGIEYAWDANRSAGTIEKLAKLVQRRYT